jgi:hypothetical protein
LWQREELDRELKGKGGEETTPLTQNSPDETTEL